MLLSDQQLQAVANIQKQLEVLELEWRVYLDCSGGNVGELVQITKSSRNNLENLNNAVGKLTDEQHQLEVTVQVFNQFLTQNGLI